MKQDHKMQQNKFDSSNSRADWLNANDDVSKGVWRWALIGLMLARQLEWRQQTDVSATLIG